MCHKCGYTGLQLAAKTLIYLMYYATQQHLHGNQKHVYTTEIDYPATVYLRRCVISMHSSAAWEQNIESSKYQICNLILANQDAKVD